MPSNTLPPLPNDHLENSSPTRTTFYLLFYYAPSGLSPSHFLFVKRINISFSLCIFNCISLVLLTNLSLRHLNTYLCNLYLTLYFLNLLIWSQYCPLAMDTWTFLASKKTIFRNPLPKPVLHLNVPQFHSLSLSTLIHLSTLVGDAAFKPNLTSIFWKTFSFLPCSLFAIYLDRIILVETTTSSDCGSELQNIFQLLLVSCCYTFSSLNWHESNSNWQNQNQNGTNA